MTTPQVAVVTGAASGIGRATVENLLDHGWSVAALDRDQEGLNAIARQRGGDLMTRTTDITRSADIERAFADARNALGPIRAVVAAAGVWTPGTVHELTDEQWNHAIAVNLTGAFNTARVALPHLLDADGGAFVAVSSDVGVQGSQSCAAYVVGKHGVVGLVRSMALDYGHRGVRSNAICPGFVETPMTQQIFRDAPPGLVQARHSEVPLGRFATPGEIAAVIRTVMSSEFGFVNGTALLVDGGATAGYYTPRETT